MKTIIISDIHGHDTWKQIIKQESDADKFVFLGDYFDTFNKKITSEIQVENFDEIIEFKYNFQGECILCVANHDISYMNPDWSCSGYNYHTKDLLKDKLKALYDNEILVPYHRYKDLIFSHAGISKVWLNDVLGVDSMDHNKTATEILEALPMNYITGIHPYGDTPSQSPVWIRPVSLLQNKIEGYTQIVGHTPMTKISEKENIWFCDVLPKEYLTIIESNNEFSFIVKKLLNE